MLPVSRAARSRERGDHVRIENLPHQEQKEQRGQEVVALVVEQVVDDAVVPAVQVTHVGHGEPGRAQEKIVQAPEGWRLYVYHLSWPTMNLLSHNAARMGKKKGAGRRKGCARRCQTCCLPERSRGARPRIESAPSFPQMEE